MKQPDRLVAGHLDNLLLWLAKADRSTLSICTYSARLALQSVGLIVLLTALLTFMASTYAIAVLFFEDGAPYRLPVSMAMAAVCAAGVTQIYRSILVMRGTMGVVLGCAFAVFYLSAVSPPIEWKIYEGAIATDALAIRQQAEWNGQQGIGIRLAEKRAALNRIAAQEGGGFVVLRFAVVAFLLMLQIAPFLVKWGFGYSEYDRAIQLTEAIRIQKRYAMKELDRQENT